MKIDKMEFDCLIIGCGISGLAAALSTAEAGLKVAVISKEDKLEESNTLYAQGGIVLSGKDDSSELLSKDIIRAGNRINFKKAVDILSKEGPAVVEDFLLNKVGINFCLNEKGDIDKTQEAAHSVRRIIHIKDNTGEVIEKRMLAFAQKNKNIHFISGCIAIDLITNTHNSRDMQQKYQRTRVIGAYIFDNKSEKVNAIFAPSVILATGGVGNLFLHTSNPKGATGDGIAMAYRVGAEIINTEYIQFHPTILFHRDMYRFLISETLRGEGARLINRKGEYFMQKYAPKLRDLAPRDQVARAIFKEMEDEGTQYVRLDAGIIKNISLKQRFPAIYYTCKELGLDICHDPIPVVPAAHYSCGGIKVNLYSRASIPGLYAVGETACTGVHGANRLASVSLMEGLLFGVRAAAAVNRSKYKLTKDIIDSIPNWIYPKREENFESVLINNDMLHIQSIMWNYAGIIRTRKRLLRALSDLNYLSHRIERFYKQARLNREIIELRNSVITATIIVRSAYTNKTGIGCHYIE